MDRRIQLLLREMEAVGNASGQELCRALEAVLEKRSRSELLILEASFAGAQFPQLAAICRTIAGTKAALH
jgi:hypothetical protein